VLLETKRGVYLHPLTGKRRVLKVAKFIDSKVRLVLNKS